MAQLLATLKALMPKPIVERFAPAYHWMLAAVAAVRYGFPSRSLTVIGVTGTNGKTTVVHLLHEIFLAAGFKVGSLSSLRFKINEREEPNLLKMTMPGRLELQKFLAECREAGCRYAILEVTSEGIKQSRHRFIRFQAAVLTNITPEHIEAHGGFEAYRTAKFELFRRLPPSGVAILNREDASSAEIANFTPAETVWYSPSAIELKGVGRPVRLHRAGPEGVRLEIENVFLESRLGGAFNARNILAAAAAALGLDVSLTAVAAGVGRVSGVPGRLEFLQTQPFAVVVDYAHTPDALEKVYQTVSGNQKSEPRTPNLICVLGSAGGGRDKWKRPEMGKIASGYCTRVILTSEDPDDEDPAEIAEDVRCGIPSTMVAIVNIVLNRREAIRQALRSANRGDTVIITGMGAQPWFIEKGTKIPWDEREIVREELTRRERWQRSG